MLTAILSSPSGSWYVGRSGLLRLGVVLIVAGLLADVQFVCAAADRSAGEASYSTGHSGSRLKWLPYRPKSARGGSKVIATQYSEPSTATQAGDATGQVPASRLFSDPFGDQKSAPAENFDGSMPQAMPEEPRPASPLPGLGTDGPIADEQPYAPPGAFPSFNQKPNGGVLKKPLLEESFAARQFELKEGCPSPNDLKDIDDLSTDITPSEGDLPRDCPLGHEVFAPRAFAPITYTWTASGLCHKPLYFEDVQLERYGHMAGPWVQPFASGAHFFLTFPILPYKMGLELPNECMYTLGYYRPGNCAPYMLDPIPLSVRAALFEAGAWVAGVYMIP